MRTPIHATAAVQDGLFSHADPHRLRRAHRAAARLASMNRLAERELARLNTALDVTSSPAECMALAREGERLQRRVVGAVRALRREAASCGVLL